MKRALALVALLVVALWAGNSSWLWGRPGETRVVAHRGLHQTFPREGLTGTTCTAERIFPPAHGFIENTVPSMLAALEAGAEVVEIDIAPTADGVLALFHDWTVDCRTEGTGELRTLTWAELAALDIGHGYTADGGESFPFRGQGLRMPRLEEALAAVPSDRLLVNFKSDDAAEATLLEEVLAGRPVWGVYGGAAPVAAFRGGEAGVRRLSADSAKSCLLGYVATGWAGHVPAACRGGIVMVPVDVAPFLWGWPHLFTARMGAAGSDVVLLGPALGGAGFSTGIDDPALAALVPEGFDGLVWTNRAEVVGPLIVR